MQVITVTEVITMTVHAFNLPGGTILARSLFQKRDMLLPGDA